MNWSKPVAMIKETFQEFKEDNALQLGAALAYYTALSLAPLMVTLVALAGLFYSGPEARQELVAQLEQLLGSEASGAVKMVLQNADQPNLGKITAVGGIVMLLLGASGVFAQLQKSLNHIWDVEPRPGAGLKQLVKVRLLAIGLVLAIGFLLLVSLVASSVVGVLIRYAESWLPAGGLLASLANVVLSIVLVAVMFGLIFRILPDVRISWRAVAMGSLCTAVLFALGQTAIGFYLGHTSTASAYGAAGSLVVLLIWVYYSSQIFFIGAEFTQVWARHYGHEIEPSSHAQWASDERHDVEEREPSRETVSAN